MALLTIRRHGVTLGIPPGASGHVRGKKQRIQGWTNRSSKGNTDFLRSVDESQIPDTGVAFTLTFKHCPDSFSILHGYLWSFFKRLEREQAFAIHFVIEWQRRGVPHVHGVCFFPFHVGPDCSIPAKHWFDILGRIYTVQYCDVATRDEVNETDIQGLRTAQRCQTFKRLHDMKGWAQYSAKHGARGANNYQRSNACKPTGWTELGRMWGKRGAWPTVEAERAYITRKGYFISRRILQRWRLADARAERKEGTRRLRIVAARRMLQGHDRVTCQIRGASEWFSSEEAYRVLEFLGDEYVGSD